MPRTYLENEIAATPPDRHETIHFEGRDIEAHGWSELIVPSEKLGEMTDTFTIGSFLAPVKL